MVVKANSMTLRRSATAARRSGGPDSRWGRVGRARADDELPDAGEPLAQHLERGALLLVRLQRAADRLHRPARHLGRLLRAHLAAGLFTVFGGRDRSRRLARISLPHQPPIL